MKILFPMRADVFKKSGGDKIQVEKYISLLKKNHGVDAKIVNHFDFTSSDADILHLTNIDRPIDTYRAYLRGRQQNIKMVLSPIHHSYEDIQNYERKGRAGFLSIFGGILNFHRLEAARGIYRSRKSLSELIYCIRVINFGLLRAQKEVLDNVLANFPLSDWERVKIEHDFGVVMKKFKVIPNGSSLSPEKILEIKRIRDIDCLIVGRVEARKNQRLILSALEILGLSGLFVGALNENHKTYCDKFLNEISKSRSKYVGVLPQTDIYDLYSRSKVHISASWFEVMSLVDIEAAAFGCAVVSSECGSTKEVMASHAFYVRPESIESIQRAIRSALSLAQNNSIVQFNLNNFKSWDEVVNELYNQYLKLI